MRDEVLNDGEAREHVKDDRCMSGQSWFSSQTRCLNSSPDKNDVKLQQSYIEEKYFHKKISLELFRKMFLLTEF